MQIKIWRAFNSSSSVTKSKCVKWHWNLQLWAQKLWNDVVINNLINMQANLIHAKDAENNDCEHLIDLNKS